MESKLVFLVLLFLRAESTTGSEQRRMQKHQAIEAQGSEQQLVQKRQSIRAQGCIAAGFTRSCAFGACRVDLPDGGHCFCDLWCIRHMHNYPQYNCCSDNPSEGLSLEKSEYFVSEGDGFVEVCGKLYGRRGLTRAFQLYTQRYNYFTRARSGFWVKHEAFQITSGERKCWNITILDDSISEVQLTHYVGVELFRVYFRKLHPSIFQGPSARVYITDDDGDPLYLQLLNSRRYPFPCDRTLSNSVVEGDDPLEICVRISGSEGETVEVNVIIVDGTATASQDYIASNQTLTFTTPERNCIRIEIVDDSEVEGNEQFWVYLTVPTDTGSEVLSQCGSVYIADNDAPTLEEMSFTVDEGDSSVQVCMHFGGEGLNVTATLTTSGTATRGSDYSFTTQSFLLRSGERRCTSIEILDDAIAEQNTERVTLQLRTRPTPATHSYVSIYIRDNDVNNVPTDPTFESNWYFVDEDAGTVQVCIHLGGEDLVDTVTLITRDGSARAGRDYSRTVQTFTVNSGERKCMTVRILNDTIAESTLEAFLVDLYSTGHPRLHFATVYIQDNDGHDLLSTAKHQGHTGSGCIGAGFIHCCTFGACRVNLSDGGHCFCDQKCSYPHHKCCFDNPCDVIAWERKNYYASESDDSVEVCLQSGQTQGIARVYIYDTDSNIYHFDEWLRITPGGRKCWNITLLDDVTFDLRDRNTHEYLKLWIILYTTSRPVQSYYSTLIIVNDKSVPAGVSLLTTESQHLSQFTRQYHNVVEGDQSATLCMRLLGRGGVVNAYLSLLDGTAKAFLDYNATNQSLLFKAGENCVDIEILDNMEVEVTEWFKAYVAITTSTGAKVLHDCERIYIYDDDAPTLEQTSFTVDEGDGSVQVCMHFGGEAQTTYAKFTIDGTALNGQDYRSRGSTQKFLVNSGERRCITIEILDDSDVESKEVLIVRLTAQSFPVRYRSCHIHIADNDGLTLSLNASAYSVAESDGFVRICVLGLQSIGNSISATATISTYDISARGGNDYTSVSWGRIMRSGSTECVSILIINDTVQEPTEVFLVTLRTSNAIRLGNYIARVEIVDDDDINECDTINGGCEQVCINTIGSFYCNCSTGYQLDGNRLNCSDVDECENEFNNCSENANCTNTKGSFICSCNPGYTGDGVNCTNINECDQEIYPCHSNANCTDTGGSFNCQCVVGFVGNGFNCTDIPECDRGLDDCDMNATCINTVGSYNCMCHTGFTGNGFTCTDIYECGRGLDKCDPNATCINSVGSYDCMCNTGFTGNGFTCTEIHECGRGLDECDPNATCINTVGSYDCMCNTGFTGNGYMCTDIDECGIKRDNCHVNATCSNAFGSFECTCDAGFQGDGVTCTNIDECKQGAHQCHMNSICTDNIGSYDCSCNTGYLGDGFYCVDINECSETDPRHNCDINADCSNADGSFVCTCHLGYTGDGVSCSKNDQPTCPPTQPPSNPCVEIQMANFSHSGYYWIPDGNGGAVQVYCSMNGSDCNSCDDHSAGVWMRIGYLNMKDASHNCPNGFHLHNYPRRCGLKIPRFIGSSPYYGAVYKYDTAGCSQITYPTYTTRYQRVCGRITAYQKGTTDAFYNHYSRNSSITSTYVDGVSITHGSLKHHIWTFAAANDEMRADQWRCPCSRCDRNFTGRVPSFVGNDYFCDSGTLLFPNPNQAYTTNPIWDGNGCALTSTCCKFNSPPWFCKKLPQTTADNIEVRVCRDQLGGDEDIHISLIEIYIA